jgi:hypothetical protein
VSGTLESNNDLRENERRMRPMFRRMEAISNFQ